jgi:RNA ligase (TIGR02306 family)
MAVESSTDHPNADRLSIVKLKGYDYKIVSAKLEDGSHRYKKNDWVIYVQSDSIVPEYLLRQGFWDDNKGMGILSGKHGDRVKPIKLRGITSEGIMFGHPTIRNVDYFEMDCIVQNETDTDCFCLGDDVSEFLGITKYEPVLPANMAGDLLYIGQDKIGHYDIENAKKFPGVLNGTGRSIFLTEKLHGTFCGIGFVQGFKHPELFTLPDFDGSFIVFSKGLGAKGLVFKHNQGNIRNNLYVRTVMENKLFEKLAYLITEISMYSENIEREKKYYVFGEIFGKGVQDLHYGLEKPEFRAFDVKFGGEYVFALGKYEFLENANFQTVPVIAVVEKEDEILPYIDGRTSLGEGSNIREGLVATPSHEGSHPELGRIILKYVSEDYLNRKGETTEYQ